MTFYVKMRSGGKYTRAQSMGMSSYKTMKQHSKSTGLILMITMHKNKAFVDNFDILLVYCLFRKYKKCEVLVTQRKSENIITKRFH